MKYSAVAVDNFLRKDEKFDTLIFVWFCVGIDFSIIKVWLFH